MTDAKNLGTSVASVDERRALDAEEWFLADQTRTPASEGMADGELSALITRLRDRRNRARDLADRQSREARSKAPPAGATPVRSDSGMRSKHDYLSEALERATAEQGRRSGGAEGQPQAELAQKAQRMKEAGGPGGSAMAEDGGALHPTDPGASEGKAHMADTARRTAPSGALDHAGELPSRERSRTRF